MLKKTFRKTIPIVLALAVAVGGFFIYNHYQPRAGSFSTGPTESAIHNDTTLPKMTTTIGPGEAPWIKQFDPKTGLPSYRFKADSYDNKPDGSIFVTNPVIELFQANGQIIRIEGTTGILHVTPGADKGAVNGAPVEPPRDGNLQNVIVKIFNTKADQDANRDQLTLTMPNAQFDNATYQLFTTDYIDPAGTTIPADQVPVQVRGRDFDFDGTGLVMFWNDRDKHLKSLDIAHGKELTLHNASTFSLTTPPATAAPPPPPAPLPHVEAPVVPPNVAPSASNVPPTSALPAPAKPRYKATFHDKVVVQQAGETLVTADNMDVDFAPKSGQPTTAPAAPPSPAPPVAPVASQPPVVVPAPIVAPAGVPNPNDVIVTWKGPLQIVPIEQTDADTLESGQSIIHLVGAPVTVHQKATAMQQATTDATCADLVYRSFDGGVLMTESTAIPVKIIQNKDTAAPSTILCRRLDFSRKDNKAILKGHGSAKFPDPNDVKSILTAAWENTCVVTLLPNATGQMQVQRCDLTGDVKVDHPRFDLSSDELDLLFEPSKKAPAPAGTNATGAADLKEMIATGNALCHVHDPTNPRSIQSQNLKLFTAEDTDGSRYAKTIHADGAVIAMQSDQELDCATLNMDMQPAAKKPGVRQQAAAADPMAGNNVELQKLEATDSVRVKGKDGASAAGDKLVVEMIDGHQHMTLTGQPATVHNKDSDTTGPIIKGVPDDQTSTVEGPGKLISTQQPTDPKQPPQKIEVVWTKGVDVEGTQNIIHVRGDVHVKTVSTDGTRDTADAETLDLLLEDKPPTTQPANHPAPATPQSAVAGADMNFMQNKQVKTIVLTDKARVEMLLADGEKILKDDKIISEKIDYDVLTHKLTVPVAGKMGVEDHEPPATQPGNAQTDSGRGANAFQWDKSFVYDEAAHQAKFDGNVIIVHRDDGPNPRQVTINADNVVADLQPAAAATTPKPANSPKMQIKLVTASGNVKVYLNAMTIFCDTLQYDPQTQLLTCKALPGSQVTVKDDEHRIGVTYGEAVINTQNNSIVRMRDVTGRAGG